MSYVIFAKDKDNAQELRQATRAAHLDYVKSSGLVLYGGPLMNEAGEMKGSLIIIDVASLKDAQEFSQNDPYTKAGLFADVQISQFQKTIERQA